MGVHMHTLTKAILFFSLFTGFGHQAFAQGDGTVGGILPSPFQIEGVNEKFWQSQDEKTQKKLIAMNDDIKKDILAVASKNKVKCMHYNNEDFVSLEHFYNRFNQVVKSQENIESVTHPERLANGNFCQNKTAEMANCLFAGWNAKRKLKKIVNNELFSTFVEYSIPIDYTRPEKLRVQERKEKAERITAFYKEIANAK